MKSDLSIHSAATRSHPSTAVVGPLAVRVAGRQGAPRVRKLLGLLVLLAGLAPLPAAARCLKYEPAIVKLDGMVSSKVLPGAPGYVSIARGDMPETILYLTLDTPVCVAGNVTGTYDKKTHAGIVEMQLEVELVKARAFVGKHVRVTGSLFGAHTGHHRTPVILRVVGIRER